MSEVLNMISKLCDLFFCDGSATKIERLRAELAGKDATIQLLRQLQDAKQQEIEHQEQIIRRLSFKLKELTEENEPEQPAKGDN